METPHRPSPRASPVCRARHRRPEVLTTPLRAGNDGRAATASAGAHSLPSTAMADATDEILPQDAPADVRRRAKAGPRVPEFDPRLGIDADPSGKGQPPNRVVAIGDSLTHGFQSGAIYNTDLSYPAIIASELGWFDHYRFPRYGGPGGLPINLELLLRDLEHRFGARLEPWELPLALFRARQFLDEVEDYWERGAGTTAPVLAAYN